MGKQNKGGESMSINIGGGELKELKPRILVLGSWWSRRKCNQFAMIEAGHARSRICCS